MCSAQFWTIVDTSKLQTAKIFKSYTFVGTPFLCTTGNPTTTTTAATNKQKTNNARDFVLFVLRSEHCLGRSSGRVRRSEWGRGQPVTTSRQVAIERTEHGVVYVVNYKRKQFGAVHSGPASAHAARQRSYGVFFYSSYVLNVRRLSRAICIRVWFPIHLYKIQTMISTRTYFGSCFASSSK